MGKEGRNRVNHPRILLSKKSVRIGLSIAAGVLLVAGIATAWLWQQRRIDELSQANVNLTQSVSNSEEAIAKADTKNRELQENIEELNKTISQIKSPEQAKLKITTGETWSKYITSNPTFQDPRDSFFYVSLTVSNNNASAKGFFSTYELRLKDAQNNVYQLCQNSAVKYNCTNGLPKYDIPAGVTELLSQEVAPGETVRGVVAFYVPNTIRNLLLTYNGSDFPLTQK